MGTVTAIPTSADDDGEGVEVCRKLADPNRVLTRLRGNVRAFDSVLQKFREVAPIQVLEARKALGARDAAGLEQATHRLRGGLLIFGAAQAMSVVETLDRCARTGDFSRGEALLGLLESELSAALAYLGTWIEDVRRQD